MLATLSASVLSLTCVPTPQEPPPDPGVVLEDIEITLRNGEQRIVHRAVLDVPNVRGREALPSVQLEFHRFPCEDKNSTAPPIFVLRGGPSFQGLGRDLQRKGFYEDVIRRHASIADVVVVGQRGIGSSAPNTTCGVYAGEALDERVTYDEASTAIAAACRECREKWQARGFDLSGFNVIEAARDVIDVADALGYRQITLVGGSFGSHWGMTIMRFHPDRVARAVFSGLEGPNHTYDMPSFVLNSLRRIAAVAEADKKLRPHIPKGGLIAAFRAVAARLDETPEIVKFGPYRILMDGRRLRQSALGTSNSTKSRRGMRTWPADMIRIVNGDLKAAAQAALRRGITRGLPTASFFNLDCGSGISAARLEILRNDPATAVLGRGEALYQAACPVWDADLGEDFRSNFKTRIPTVLVHGTWDTSTPFDNAIELAPFFEVSRFVVVEGGSHGALGEATRRSKQLRDALQSFLRSGDLQAVPELITLPPVDWKIP